MNLHSAIAVLGLAGAASADLSYTFDFADFVVEDNGFINGFVFTDLSSEYVGETLTSIDWDLSFTSASGGVLDAIMYLDGGFNGWYGLNFNAGVDSLDMGVGGGADPVTNSFAGSFDASAFGIVLGDGGPYLMGGGVVYASADGAGSIGELTGTITFNMTPAPGALALLGMAGLGRRKRS